jgi:hypothetical protein
MFSRTYEIFADYHQFYLQDEEADGDLSDAWTDESVSNLLAVVEGAIGVGTVRNMDVPVTVEIHTNEPELDSEKWDRVNECSLSVPSGKIVIAGCTDYFPNAERIVLEPGTYRVRISYGKLKSTSADGLDGEDHYRVQLWLGNKVATIVIKAHDS